MRKNLKHPGKHLLWLLCAIAALLNDVADTTDTAYHFIVNHKRKDCIRVFRTYGFHIRRLGTEDFIHTGDLLIGNSFTVCVIANI